MTQTVLRRRQVERRIGLSRSTIYAGVKAGSFPRPIRIGARAVGWLERDIDAWLAQHIAASREALS